jgi:hypothetical protein
VTSSLRGGHRRQIALLAWCVATALLVVEPAVAATVGGEIRQGGNARFLGVIRYRAGDGVANRVRVEPAGDGFKITDPAERVRAFGDCRQAGRHSALCFESDSEPALEVAVSDKADRVVIAHGCRRVESACIRTAVRGGPGDDTLIGGGEFYGDRGHDLLRGMGTRYSWDHFHGGPGRDRLEGRGPNGFTEDVFYDDESDAQASRDVVVGGSRARALIIYSKRTRGLKIDLHRKTLGPERDRVSGVKSVIGGSGDDWLIGTGGQNALGGGPGNDRLEGRKGADALSGGGGDDLARGGDGHDSFAEEMYLAPSGGGSDRLIGGAGSDFFATRESSDPESGPDRPDVVDCDAADRPVASERLDRLRGCEGIRGWGLSDLEMRVDPALTPWSAVYTLRCGPTESDEQLGNGVIIGYTHRCRGRLSLWTGTGDRAGSQTFEFETPDGRRTPWMTVEVSLTDEGRAAIRAGTVLEVEVKPLSSSGQTPPPAGYRAYLQG